MAFLATDTEHSVRRFARTLAQLAIGFKAVAPFVPNPVKLPKVVGGAGSSFAVTEKPSVAVHPLHPFVSPELATRAHPGLFIAFFVTRHKFSGI